MLLSHFLLAFIPAMWALAHPMAMRRAPIVQGLPKRATAPELDSLFEGNKQFRASITQSSPLLLKQLTDDGQSPPFMFLGCSDSRVSEGTIFNAKPGTLFTERNIANQFHHTDANAHSVLSYAVAELGVKHVIVMGHYGCGGVAAAIATPPKAQVDAANGAIQNWIAPIREIFATSTRPEIVALREKIKGQAVVEEPEPQDPGFRALVEENIKASVHAIATDSVLVNHFALLTNEGNSTNATAAAERRAEEASKAGDVFVHGWVYDIENGEIKDLGISVGPAGKEMPTIPFAPVTAVANATQIAANVNLENSEKAVREQCAEQCKAKRGI